MKRFAVLVYGIICYLAFLGAFLYLIGFTGNVFVPKGIDGPLTGPLWQAILINLGLIALFTLQHSLMARSWFKRWWTQIVPEAMERSTYVLFTSVALAILFYFWQPLGGIIWQFENPAIISILMACFAMGYTIVLISSFMINHFDLFGLRQTWFYFQQKPYSLLKFRTPFLYKYVRHPLYLGLLIAFWAAPVMSVTRLFFVSLFTVYILKAIRWEENDLISIFGDTYRKYAANVPMILPSFISRKKEEPVYQTIAERNNRKAA